MKKDGTKYSNPRCLGNILCWHGITLLLVNLMCVEGVSCRSSFFKLYQDSYLPGRVIQVAPVTSQFDCSVSCLMFAHCHAWNLFKTLSSLKCELLNLTLKATARDGVSLLKRKGSVSGQRFNVERQGNNHAMKTQTYVFTTLAAEGENGPTDTDGYLGTSLEGSVRLRNGIQEWRVPRAGTYEIESRGASGANGTCAKSRDAHPSHLGGVGAKVSGKFILSKGVLLKILVGQSGTMNSIFGDRPGGGGGGSFVTFSNNTPLVIAGGGGGAGGCNAKLGKSDGDAGQHDMFGSRCNSSLANGGILCSVSHLISIHAGGGAGLLGDGSGVNSGPTHDAQSFVSGGRGGFSHIKSNGGFGGGGYAWTYGGGGGGYSGGGVWANATTGVAGGGGSVNHGYEQRFGYGDWSQGLVRITFIA